MRLLPTAILAWLLFGAIGTLGAVLAVRSVVRGEYPSAVVALGASAFCYGLIIPLVKVVRGNVIPRGEVDDAGTTIRPDRGIDIPVLVSLFGLVIASALIAVLAPLGKLDIPVPPALRFSLPFVSAVIVVTGGPMLWRNLLRGSTKYLRLTPDGFEIVQGWRPQSGDWAQVADVTDAAPNQSAPTPSAIVMVMSDGSAPSLAAASSTPDGRALRELVRFYWGHPTHRAELTDGRALERLRNEQFDVDLK
ncbi:MAG: hypothetical protein QOF88_5556 [Mycobacterium sp.]|jgi:hypothetical protein|nr:hypothetical protein [Mycobacterium sp.]MDT5360407.1 hypothetical protein [Mycobacterium sp.]